MHNLHIIVVSSINGKSACDEALEYIEDWGNEDNFRECIGAISEMDEIYKNDENSSNFKSFFNTYIKSIDSVNILVQKWMDNQDCVNYGKLAMTQYLEGRSMDIVDWQYIENLVDLQLELLRQPKDHSFNVLHDEFFSYQFDKKGVTNIVNPPFLKDMKKWIVFIDMHC